MPSNRPVRQGRPANQPAYIGFLVLTIFCWLALAPAAALAATWTGGGADDNWSTAGNWVGGVLPVNGDTVTYDASSVARLTSGNNNLALTSLTIEVTNAGPAAVTISGNTIGLAGIDTDSSRGTPLTLTINNNLNLEAGGTIALSTLSGFGGSSVVNLNGSLSLGANTLSVTGSNAGWGGASVVSLNFNGGVSGSGGISANGLLTIYANSALTYTGATTLTDACGIELGGGGSLPSSSAFSLVDGGTGGGAIHLNGRSGTVGSVQAAGNRGVIYFSGGSLTMGGNNASTAFSGWLVGPGSLVKTGTGTFTLNAGIVSNSLTSLTVNGGTFQLGAANLLPDALTLILGAGGTFALNDFNETIGNFSGSGALSLGTGTLTFGNASNTSFSGSVTSTGFGLATINKQGSGSFTLSTGTTINTAWVELNLNAGTFVMDGNWVLISVDVNNGATLAGSGMIGMGGAWIHAGGTISPGSSPGRLGIQDGLAMDAGSSLNIELNGTTPITEYDQVLVEAGIDLPGNLNLSLGYAPSVGDTYTIIDNTMGAPALSPFAGTNEGSTITAGGYRFRITYVGGDGNDVVLTALSSGGGGTTPEPEPEPEPEPKPGVDPPDAPQVSQGDSPSPTGSLNGTTLSWPHVAGSNFYRVYRAACPTCAKTQVGRVSGTSFIDQSALPGLVYYYFVRTENGGGLSGYSDWVPAWRYDQNPGRAGDFNGDGVMDLLWWQADGNLLSIWYMSGGNVQSVSAPGDALDISEWLLVGTGDFNGDGVSDLMWWKPETGEVVVWYLDKAADAAGGAGEWMVKSSAALDSMTGNATISYSGDFNGDGRTDLVWRDYATGQATIWLMGDDGKPALTGPPTLADGMSDGGKPGVTDSLEWALRGLNDMDGDGKADVVWQHASDGRVVVWRMDGSQALSLGEYQRNDPANWRIAGLGDLNGDGLGDMVWRNDSSGAVQVWLTASGDSGYEARDITVSADAPAAWRLNATGDFCGDGCADLYCKSEPDGAKRIVTLAGQSFTPVAP